MKSKIVIAIAAVALLSVMIASANACYLAPGRTPGYWKHNINVAMGGNGAYSWYHDNVKLDKATVVAIVAAAGFPSLQDALTALSPPSPAATRDGACFKLNTAALLDPYNLV